MLLSTLVSSHWGFKCALSVRETDHWSRQSVLCQMCAIKNRRVLSLYTSEFIVLGLRKRTKLVSRTFALTVTNTYVIYEYHLSVLLLMMCS